MNHIAQSQITFRRQAMVTNTSEASVDTAMNIPSSNSDDLSKKVNIAVADFEAKIYELFQEEFPSEKPTIELQFSVTLPESPQSTEARPTSPMFFTVAARFLGMKYPCIDGVPSSGACAIWG
jgi:hypothetical protein